MADGQANPHKRLRHLYGARMMTQYRGVPLGELSPHVYAIAEQVLQGRCSKASTASKCLTLARPEACCRSVMPRPSAQQRLFVLTQCPFHFAKHFL